MSPETIQELLGSVARGELSVDAAGERLRTLPYESLGFARIDHHRQLRLGAPEVIFGAGKTVEQVVEISLAMLAAGSNVLCTRTTKDVCAAVRDAVARADIHSSEPHYFDPARVFSIVNREPTRLGQLGVLAAGTSDLPVAEEAAVSAEFFGAEVSRLYDVGVAGIHRLLDQRDQLDPLAALIVVAGMEGALPSVVGGLVGVPVIAVPTSVGYGASFGGIAALLGMLNSCAAGVTVVNIDNGFGAAAAAHRILRGHGGEKSNDNDG